MGKKLAGLFFRGEKTDLGELRPVTPGFKEDV